MNRSIFQYNDGERDVFGDPLMLRDRLFTVSQGEFWNLRKKVAAIDAAKDDATIIMEGIAARGHLVEIARATFSMAAYDPTTGKGALAEQCLATTELFLHFLDQKKTSSAPPPTTFPSTASIPPTPTPGTTPTM